MLSLRSVVAERSYRPHCMAPWLLTRSTYRVVLRLHPNSLLMRYMRAVCGNFLTIPAPWVNPFSSAFYRPLRRNASKRFKEICSICFLCSERVSMCARRVRHQISLLVPLGGTDPGRMQTWDWLRKFYSENLVDAEI